MPLARKQGRGLLTGADSICRVGGRTHSKERLDLTRVGEPEADEEVSR